MIKSRKKLKTSAAAASTSTSPDATADTKYRDWESLPDGPLTSILSLLLSHADVAAFSAVCRCWRSLAGSASSTLRPPLLLLPIVHRPNRSSIELRWSRPPRCRLLSPIPNSPTHLSPLPSATLTHFLIGNSSSHLIFIRNRRILISNPFSGESIHPPDIEIDGSKIYTHAFLTAPVSDPHSRLLLTGSVPTVLVWQLGSREWGQQQLGRDFVTPIQQILPFKDRLIAMDYGGKLFTVSFFPRLRFDLWEDLMPLPENDFTFSYDRLVECGGELLRVVFSSTGQLFVGSVMELLLKEMKVYKLDSSRKVASWLRVESMGDWCLFIDVRGKSITACSELGKWGGRKNLVYMTGPGCDSWTELALGGPLIDTCLPESPFHATKAALPPWPSPLWFYPSLSF